MRKGLLLLFLTGCATSQWQDATKFVAGPSRQEITKMKVFTFMALSAVDREMQVDVGLAETADIKIRFMDGRFECNPDGGLPEKCVGVHRPRIKEIIVAYKPGMCLAYTSLAHELIHAMLHKIRGYGDAGHEQQEYWNTALNNANRMYCETNCRGFCSVGK